MGYRRPSLHLVFAEEGDELDGLEIRARRYSVGAVLDLAELIDLGAAELQRDRSRLGEFLDAIAAPLVSWNLEDDDGTPVPATAEGLRGQDLGFVTRIAHELLRANAGVSRPLEPSSNGGQPSEEEVLDLPMESLSASPGP